MSPDIQYESSDAVELEFRPDSYEGDKADREAFNKAIGVLEETDRYEVVQKDEELGKAIGATEDYEDLKEFMRTTDLYVDSHYELFAQ